MDRRDFIKTVVAGVGVVAAADASPAMAQSLPPAVPDNVVPRPGQRHGAIAAASRHEVPGAGPDRRGGVAGGHGRLPPGQAGRDDQRRGDPRGACRSRCRHQLLRQLLGLQRRRKRGPSRPRAVAGGLPAPRVPDDQDRRPHREGGDGPDRDLADPAADRPSRPAAVPRDHPRRRSRPRVRAGRRAGSGAEGARAGQAALYRLHRPQEPGDPRQHVRDRRPARLPLRHRADAAQRHGRALRQLREDGGADGGGARHRHHRHEGVRRQRSSCSRA